MPPRHRMGRRCVVCRHSRPGLRRFRRRRGLARLAEGRRAFGRHRRAAAASPFPTLAARPATARPGLARLPAQDPHGRGLRADRGGQAPVHRLHGRRPPHRLRHRNRRRALALLHRRPRPLRPPGLAEKRVCRQRRWLPLLPGYRNRPLPLERTRRTRRPPHPGQRAAHLHVARPRRPRAPGGKRRRHRLLRRRPVALHGRVHPCRRCRHRRPQVVEQRQRLGLRAPAAQQPRLCRRLPPGLSGRVRRRAAGAGRPHRTRRL